LLYLQEAQGFSRTDSKSRLVYYYSKHSPQGEGNDKTCNISAAASTDKHENKLVAIQENVSDTKLDSVQVGNKVKGAYMSDHFGSLLF
jgi:hypothetical protein